MSKSWIMIEAIRESPISIESLPEADIEARRRKIGGKIKK
jgi:hypothetical protein